MSEASSSTSQKQQSELDQSLIETIEELQLSLEEVRCSINTVGVNNFYNHRYNIPSPELTHFGFSLGLRNTQQISIHYTLSK